MKILQREEQKQGMLLMAKIRRQWDAQEQRFEQELQVNCPWIFSNETWHFLVYNYAGNHCCSFINLLFCRIWTGSMRWIWILRVEPRKKKSKNLNWRRMLTCEPHHARWNRTRFDCQHFNLLVAGTLLNHSRFLQTNFPSVLFNLPRIQVQLPRNKPREFSPSSNWCNGSWFFRFFVFVFFLLQQHSFLLSSV